MFYISEIRTEALRQLQTPLQGQVYAVLNTLQIPFVRVGTEEIIRMADCGGAVLAEERYGHGDGTTNGALKIRTQDVQGRLLPFAKHLSAIIEV